MQKTAKISRKRAENKWFESVFSGASVGLATSLLGGGGGMIAVPLLKALSLKERVAHATAILVILPVSFLSFILYAFRGYADFSIVIPTAIGVSIGGVLGAKLLNKLSGKTVEIIFSILQVLAGLWLLFF